VLTLHGESIFSSHDNLPSLSAGFAY